MTSPEPPPSPAPLVPTGRPARPAVRSGSLRYPVTGRAARHLGQRQT